MNYCTVPNSHKEAHSQIDALRSAAQNVEADLAPAQAEPHRALTLAKLPKRSRAMLSKSHNITQTGLEWDRHA